MDDYHSWLFIVVIVLYVGSCLYNFIREGRIGKNIELKDSDFPSDIMVCKSNGGRPWLYKRSNGEPLPPPPRIITNNCVHSFEECWLKTYGKTK